MPERYPADAELLALNQDTDTGVDYIPTGRSPYFLEYRRSVYRMLDACRRANDLRVYPEDGLTVGVRPGRCYIGTQPVAYAGQTGLAVPANSTTWFWVDATGAVQSSTDGLPTDRAAFIPLAQVVAGDATLDGITDLRGEAFLQAPSAAVLGLTATPAEINQALDGIAAGVTPTALNQLTAGPFAGADNYHSHTQLAQNVAGQADFRITNQSFDPTASLALRFSVPELHPSDTVLSVHPTHRFFEQSVGNTRFTLVGAVHQSYVFDGDLVTNQTDRPVGVVPLDGEVVAVVLSVADNLQSSTGTDRLEAVVKVNGVALTDTSAAVSADDGAGFVSTQRGDGTPAVLKADGTEHVQRGDVLTVDFIRHITGAVGVEPRHPAVLVVIRAGQPE